MKTKYITIFVVLVYTFFMCPASANKNVLTHKKTSGELVFYSGTITVSGKYRWRFDENSLMFDGNSICFDVDQATSSLIPRIGQDKRSAWFCFSNREDAMKLLRIPKNFPSDYCGFTGNATIEITDYVANLAQHAVHDYARLVRASSSGPSQPFICKECICRPNWPNS